MYKKELNPFHYFEEFKLDKFDGGKLIAVGASAGNGKSVALNSMILNYVSQGINVIIFSENPSICYPVFEMIRGSKDIKIGQLVICPLTHVKDIFQKDLCYILNHYFMKIKGRLAVIIDGDINSSLNFDLISENTRRVIFEKYKPIKIKVTENKYESGRREAEELRNLAITANLSIVITKQLLINYSGIESSVNTFPFQTLYASDLVITISKKECFIINKIKSRYGSEKKFFKCSFDNKTRSLILI